MTGIFTPLVTLATFADRIGARCWIGPTPTGDPLLRARVIADRIGYPDARTLDADHDPVAMLIPVDRTAAAHVLAVAAGSLAYGHNRPEPADYSLAVTALAPFGTDATFLANGRWDRPDGSEWIPLSAATFDAGVIGWNTTHAFILWVEEED